MTGQAMRPAMSELEEQLARDQGGGRLDAISAQLAAIESRLQQRAMGPLPADQFRSLECSLLAVRAATEVVSSLRPQGKSSGTNPYVDGKAFFRSTESP